MFLKVCLPRTSHGHQCLLPWTGRCLANKRTVLTDDGNAIHHFELLLSVQCAQSQEMLFAQVDTKAKHAVLLTNYLTGLGRTCYLVLGRGMPEGKTAYCLTIEVSCLYFHLSTCLTFNTGE